MRFQSASLLLALLVGTQGCMVHRLHKAGRHADVLQRGVPRKVIQRELGEPVHSSRQCDEFIVRGKVAVGPEPGGWDTSYGMTIAATAGLADFCLLPIELCAAIGDTFSEHRVTVWYDGDGAYQRHRVDWKSTRPCPSDTVDGSG